MKRFLMVALLLCASWSVQAEQLWRLNLQDADLRELVAAVSDITGKTLLLEAKVAGTVTVVAQQPLNRDGIYALFLSVLKSNGFAAVEQGGQTVIVPLSEAKTRANEVRHGRGDQFVTAVLPLNATSAADMAAVLRPLVAEDGYLAPSVSSNALVISDSASNIARMRAMLRELDTNQAFSIVPLQHAWAAEVAKVLSASLMRDGQAMAFAKIISDVRANRLIVIGSASTRLQITRLAQAMDVPSTRSDNAQVVRLQHGTAKKIAELLGGLDQEGGGNAPRSDGSGEDNGGSGKVVVRADESQNALVLMGAPEQLAQYKSIIAQLDRPRAQVLVEAAIVEVTGDISEALGVQWAFNSANVRAGANFGEKGVSVGSVMGAALGADLPNGAVLGLGSPRFGALISALAGNTKANLLSTPSLLTLDNEKAEIMVGQNVPFVSASYDTNNKDGKQNPYSTIERKDVGISLKVTPRINEGDTFRLEIEQESSDVLKSQPGIDAKDLITSKRQLKTTILAADGQIIVLGGLIKDSIEITESKVPLLGDIPLLGALFRYKNEARKKTNLMIFLRPMLIRDGAAAAAISERKYEKVRSSERGAVDAPVLPVNPAQIFDAPSAVSPAAADGLIDLTSPANGASDDAAR